MQHRTKMRINIDGLIALIFTSIILFSGITMVETLTKTENFKKGVIEHVNR
jgi:hypothetical protein